MQGQGPGTLTAASVFLPILMFFPTSDVIVYFSEYPATFAYILSWALAAFCRRFGRTYLPDRIKV